MKRDYALTFAAEFLVLAAGLCVFGVASAYWRPEAFGEYLVARRVLALVHGSVSLGLGVSLPRYIASASAAGAEQRPGGAYLAAGLGMVMAILLLVGTAFATAPEFLAKALFGNPEYRVLLGPIYICLIGVLLHTLAYGHFRGHLNMAAANALQLVNQGAAHLLPFAMTGLTPGRVLAFVGAIWILTAGTALIVLFIRDGRRHLWRAGTLLAHAWKLLQYGGPRIPGDIILSALFNLPASLAAHFGTIQEAGYVAFGLSALSLIGGVFAPVGLVQLPAATRMVALGETARLEGELRLVVGGGAVLTLAGVILLELIATPLVTWYLGPAYAPAAGILRLVILGAIPYVVYVLLRSALDALSVRAINTRNLAVGLGTFALVVALFRSVNSIVLGLSISMTVVGALSLQEVRRLLRGRPPLGPPGDL